MRSSSKAEAAIPATATAAPHRGIVGVVEAGDAGGALGAARGVGKRGVERAEDLGGGGGGKHRVVENQRPPRRGRRDEAPALEGRRAHGIERERAANGDQQ